MPTYLTPGVYVEEVPSASKPIEGVGTSTAAFVGLAPGGPVNKPVRISNWTQFAKVYGDQAEPENGPFMPGAYLAHSVFGFFQNGGTDCWVVRVGGGRASNGDAPRAALPSAAEADTAALQARVADGANDEVRIELTEETAPPSTTEEKDADEESGNGGAQERREPTYRLHVTAGDREENYEGLTLKRNRTANLLKQVNSASKLIQLEEPAGSVPESKRAPAPGVYTISPPAPSVDSLTSREFEGDVARRNGMGGLAAVDEVTMVCMPDLMVLKQNGDDTALRDVQGKIIAHCEASGD